MSEKPSLKIAETLEDINNRIASLYEKRREITSKVLKKFGEGPFYYDLTEKRISKKPYLKIQISDNIKKLQEGGSVFKAHATESYEISVSRLKTKPKDL